jgi:hypothetical protein
MIEQPPLGLDSSAPAKTSVTLSFRQINRKKTEVAEIPRLAHDPQNPPQMFALKQLKAAFRRTVPVPRNPRAACSAGFGRRPKLVVAKPPLGFPPATATSTPRNGSSAAVVRQLD